jgi:hypothetical protein
VIVNIEEETEAFRKELSEGMLKVEKLPNTAEKYSEAKEDRDNQAFLDFLETDIFESIAALK